MSEPLQRRDICAIVVTYHPDAELPRRVRDISQQVGATVLVDNGSADHEVAALRQCAGEGAVALVLNPENLGVARALNIGVQQAASLGYQWVLLLDQDTRVAADMVATLCTIQEEYPGKERLAIIGSNFWEKHRRSAKASQFDSCGAQWDEVAAVITTGSLLSLQAFSDIGPFREDFFIDYVDTEYCLRARVRGYRVLKTRRALMFHSIGRPTRHRLLWMKKWTSNHSADRRYYMARNHTVMVHESGKYRFGSWALFSFLSCIKSWKRIALYEQEKGSKIAAVFFGWRDGVRGSMGPRNKQRDGDSQRSSERSLSRG